VSKIIIITNKTWFLLPAEEKDKADKLTDAFG
jgi:hypothetical protein